jgi:hypothetical protein
MPDELRLKMEQSEEDKSVQGLLERLTVAVHQVNSMRQTMSNVDGRGLSIAITHIETACLWIKEATKVESDGT